MCTISLCFGALLVSVLVGYYTAPRGGRSLVALNAFIKDQSARAPPAGALSLITSDYSIFAGALCYSAPNYSAAVRGVAAGLHSVPVAVASRIIAMAILDPCTMSHATTESDHNNVFVQAFWHTECVAGGYEVCIAVSGARVELADEVVGTYVQKKNHVIGSEPCHCVLLWCKTCPVIEQRESRAQVTEKQKLTIGQREELSTHLRAAAVKRAKEVQATTFAIGSTTTKRRAPYRHAGHAALETPGATVESQN